jgi:hypothetical protein
MSGQFGPGGPPIRLAQPDIFWGNSKGKVSEMGSPKKVLVGGQAGPPLSRGLKKKPGSPRIFFTEPSLG